MLKDHATVWDNCLQTIRRNVNLQSYKTWFEPITPVRLDNNALTIQVPNKFFYEWLEEHYVSLLKTTIRKELGDAGRLEYQILMGHSKKRKKLKIPKNGDSYSPGMVDTENIKNPFVIPGIKKLKIDPQLNPGYTFENYIEGDCNRLARSAGFAIAKNPGATSFNPLVVHGNVGLGKTHLLQAICHAIKRKPDLSRVLYLSCEDFTNRFILSIQTGRLNEFREHYRSADMLVIDDVQFLAGKKKTQDEFFHTFNALHNNNKQIVISSDRPPVEIPTIEERLVSRFKWGLVTDIELPCFETRLAIVNRKARLRSVEFPDDVAQYIAERMTSSIRELEGAVIKVIGIAALTERAISISLAEEAMKGLVSSRSTKISVEDIIDLITGEFSISARDLTGKGRTQAVSLPRQIGMYLARSHTDHSLEELGRHFGNRDHTTVLYAVTKIKNRARTDRMFNELLANLSARLQSGNFQGSSSKLQP